MSRSDSSVTDDETSGPEPVLTSFVVTSAADPLLSEAITVALQADAPARPDLLARLLREIEEFMKAHPEERPWTFSIHEGTDGSRIFRGGTGRSLVVDPAGDLWRARNYEDFETAYAITESACTITALTPIYEQMVRYELR